MARSMMGLSLVAALLAGCSGPNGQEQTAEAAGHDDVATGARLMREHPLSRAKPEEKTTRLAECAGILQTAAQQTPPPPRAQSMQATADRLYRVAVSRAQREGGNEGSIQSIRDETIAANRQLASRQPQQFAQLLEQGATGCDMASIMTDDELSQ